MLRLRYAKQVETAGCYLVLQGIPLDGDKLLAQVGVHGDSVLYLKTRPAVSCRTLKGAIFPITDCVGRSTIDDITVKIASKLKIPGHQLRFVVEEVAAATPTPASSAGGAGSSSSSGTGAGPAVLAEGSDAKRRRANKEE